MTDKPRFQLLDVKVLTRVQRWIVGVTTLGGVFGLVLCLTGSFPLGILCLGLSAMTNTLTNPFGRGGVWTSRCIAPLEYAVIIEGAV